MSVRPRGLWPPGLPRLASLRTWCTSTLPGSPHSSHRRVRSRVISSLRAVGGTGLGMRSVRTAFLVASQGDPAEPGYQIGLLPSRSTLASKHLRSPYRVWILACVWRPSSTRWTRCLAGRVGCTARSRIPCGCGPFLCSLPPNPACTFQRTGLSSDLCRVRDRVCVDPVISCRARGERQVPLRLLHCASLMVPSSFIACAPSPCGPSLAVSRLGGRYPAD